MCTRIRPIVIVILSILVERERRRSVKNEDLEDQSHDSLGSLLNQSFPWSQ